MWLAWLTTASAQEVASPIARCADAAAGTEVEVCLQLAAEHPDQLDGIAAALRAHVARSGSDDRDLLLALLALVDDATAPAAAARIGELGDRRGVPALVACAERRSAAVAEACVAAVAPFHDGVGHLARWLVDEDEALGLREAAAHALGDLGKAEAADQLVDALRRPRLPPMLRRVILEEIRSSYPERASELEGQVASDGRLWLAAGGAWGMGFAMGAAGHYGQTNLASLGWVTGGVGGATAGWLYGRAWPMEAGDAAYLTTSGVLGTTSGMLLGAAFDQGSGDAVYGGGLGGMVVGYGASAITRVPHRGTAGDSLEATGVAGLASVAAVSATAVGVANGPRATHQVDGPLLAAGLGLAGGSVVGHLVAPHVDLSGHDAGLVGLGSLWGGAVGTLVPIGSAERNALPATGLAVGGLLGYGLAAPLDVPWDQQIAAGAGLAYGGAFGAGLGLLLDPNAEHQVPQGTALGLGTAGMVGGAVLARLDPEPVDDRDVVFVGLVTGWSTWQAVGWAVAVQSTADQAGWFVLAPAALGATAALASPEVDVPVPEGIAATSLGLWGAYVGGVAAELAEADPLVWSLVGSDVGLAGGSVLLSPMIGAPPVVIGVADAGGVLIGSTAALGTAFATDDPDAILTASLIGAGAGLTGGALVGVAWKRGGTRDMARAPVRLPGRWLIRPDLGVDRSGIAVEVHGW